jgi:hypothetical protein
VLESSDVWPPSLDFGGPDFDQFDRIWPFVSDFGNLRQNPTNLDYGEIGRNLVIDAEFRSWRPKSGESDKNLVIGSFSLLVIFFRKTQTLNFFSRIFVVVDLIENIL